jgi:hypothetical protein
MSTTITPTEQNIEINVNNDVIDINVTNEIVDVNATTQQIDINVAGAYPIPNPVLSVFGRTGLVVATEGDYTLTQLGDVTLSSPSNGQVLKYNGTAWVNGTDAGGITTLNTLTALSQTFATGTSGTDFNISSATSTHTFNLPTASATNRGALSSSDWSVFNAKQNALTLTTTGTSGAATLVGATLNIPQYQSVLTNPITGTGTSGQVAYFNGTNSITSNAAFAFTPTSQLLVNNSVTAASAIARGTNLTPTLIAAASLDTLIGLDINPTFTNGAFADVNNYVIRATLGNNKTSTSSRIFAIALRTNDATQPQKLDITYLGNATANSRSYIFQTGEEGVAFNGNITFQNQGGRVLIGTNTGVSLQNVLEIGGSTLVKKDQNLGTVLEISNTTSGTGSSAILLLTSSNGSSRIGKYSATSTTYKTLLANDNYLYNATSGNISILNDFSSGNINFAAGGASTAQATLFSTGNVGINTTTDAGFRLDVNGTARVQGVLTTTADAVINGLTVGRGAGNIDTNTALGISALSVNTGNSNTAIGRDSITNTTGSFNTGVGRNTLRYVSSGGTNTGIGGNALINVSTGSSNTAVGVNALQGITTASNNTAIGISAGGFISGGSVSNITGSNSIFIGYNAFPLADSQTNQIVIGYNVVGLGSNTTVLGNASTVTTAIYGDLLIGTTTALASTKLTVSGSETASSAIARGQLLNTTLVAAANNDVLVGLDINPTFTNGAFTGVSNHALRILNYNTTSSQVRIGGLEIQSYSLNNTWIGDNVYFDGTNFKVRQTGFTSMLYFNQGEGQIRATTSLAAGSSITSSTNTQLKSNPDGTFAVGSAIANQVGNYTGAKFIVFGATGNTAINQTTDAGFRLDVNGTGRVSGAFSTDNITVGQGAGTTYKTIFTSVGGNPAIIQSIATIGSGSAANNVMQFRCFDGFNPTGQLTISGDGTNVFEQSNTPTRFSSAMVAINSTTKGFLPPRLTTTQKNAISSPATGLVVYDTTLNKLSVYTGAAWETVTSL